MACLQAQLMQVKAQLAQNMDHHHHHNQWSSNNICGLSSSSVNQTYPTANNDYDPISSPQSSLEYVNHSSDSPLNMMSQTREEFCFQGLSKKTMTTPCNTDLGELQALALRMMRN